jgi:UDP-glucose 4-epimerase
MKVLVTGAAGYAGRFVAHGLSDQGHDVIALDNLVEGSVAALPDRCVFVEADVRDTAMMEQMFSDHAPDAVVHLAGFTLIPPSLSDPLGCFEMNVGTTLNLLRIMANHGVRRVVFSSSAAVYGMPMEVPVPETHGLAPENPYGRSKLMIEQLLSWCLDAYGIRSVSFRYFNVAGAIPTLGESRRVETHLLPLLFSAATGKTIPDEGSYNYELRWFLQARITDRGSQLNANWNQISGATGVVSNACKRFFRASHFLLEFRSNPFARLRWY